MSFLFVCYVHIYIYIYVVRTFRGQGGILATALAGSCPGVRRSSLKMSFVIVCRSLPNCVVRVPGVYLQRVKCPSWSCVVRCIIVPVVFRIYVHIMVVRTFRVLNARDVGRGRALHIA